MYEAPFTASGRISIKDMKGKGDLQLSIGSEPYGHHICKVFTVKDGLMSEVRLITLNQQYFKPKSVKHQKYIH